MNRQTFSCNVSAVENYANERLESDQKCKKETWITNLRFFCIGVCIGLCVQVVQRFNPFYVVSHVAIFFHIIFAFFSFLHVLVWFVCEFRSTLLKLSRYLCYSYSTFCSVWMAYLLYKCYLKESCFEDKYMKNYSYPFNYDVQETSSHFYLNQIVIYILDLAAYIDFKCP